MGKDIVVIGANGFVGNSLVNSLSEDPSNTVYCFDRFSNGAEIKPRINTIQINGDYFSDGDIDKISIAGSYVIHCLSVSNPSSSISSPYLDIDLLKRNVEVFNKFISAGVKKIGYISSGGAVYGNIKNGDVADEEYPTSPLSPYGIGKLATELYLDYMTKNTETSYMVFRLSNPYGGEQKFKNGLGVIPKFIDSIRNDEPLTIVGDGTASRDYIYIDDAVDMITRSFLSDKENKIYNIGSGTQTSLNELIGILTRELGKEVSVDYQSSPAGYPLKTPISIDSFVHDHGLPDFTELTQGIRKILAKD